MNLEVRSPEDDGVACDLCGHAKFQQLHAWEVGNRWNPATIPIAVWKCEQCELVSLHPVPTTSEMPDGREWWHSQRRRFRRNRWFKERWEKLRSKIFGKPAWRLIQATRRAKANGCLLDVGAGMGELLGFAKETYDCVALEPSPIAAQALRDKGFQVIESTLEAAEIDGPQFDVITLDSVIEHVSTPTNVLKKINRIMNPGGVVVLKTPKYGGPASRQHGSEWNGFRHGHHTFLFSGETLGNCLKAAGFEVLKSPQRDRMLDDILILWARKTRETTEAGYSPPGLAIKKAA